jgi:hypothetical protein
MVAQGRGSGMGPSTLHVQHPQGSSFPVAVDTVEDGARAVWREHDVAPDSRIANVIEDAAPPIEP